MARISDIIKVDEVEANLVKKQSAILLQKKSEGFNGELKTSGYIVENYIKEFLKKHVPNGYRICSGYIATTDTMNSSDNLLQHDIIIADNRIPSIYVFGIGDIEVVPAEAVCGIFEIKRTLNNTSAKVALDHLASTRAILDVYKEGLKSKTQAMNNAIGTSVNVASTAPIYGIIALDAAPDALTMQPLAEAVVNFIDIVWAISQPLLLHFSIRDSGGSTLFPLYASRNQEPYTNTCREWWFQEKQKAIIYASALSYLRVWINNTAGRILDSNDTQLYFGLR